MKRSADSDKVLMNQANELKKLKNQCEIVKNILSEKLMKPLSKNYNSFYKQISKLCQQLESEIFNSIPDEPTSDDIPKLIEGLKIDHININIECIEKIDNYLEEQNDIKTIYDYHITPYLFKFCNTNNFDLQYFALSILIKLSDHLKMKEKEEKDAVSSIIRLISSTDHYVQSSSIEFIGKYVEDNEKRRNLLFDCGVLKYLNELLDPNTDFSLLSKVLTTIKNLCKPYRYKLPLKQYTKKLAMGLNALLFIDNDEILKGIFEIYEYLMDRNCNKRLNCKDIMKGTYSENILRAIYKKKAKNDDKLFKKSIEDYEQKI